MRTSLIWVAPTIATLLVGCKPYFGSCYYARLEASERLRSIAERHDGAECYTLTGSITGQYGISGPGYEVVLDTGHRWYPELFVFARDPDGRPLAIQSDQLLKSTTLTAPQDSALYFLSIAPPAAAGSLPAPIAVAFSVVGNEDKILGSERLTVRIERARHFSWDAL